MKNPTPYQSDLSYMEEINKELRRLKQKRDAFIRQGKLGLAYRQTLAKIEGMEVKHARQKEKINSYHTPNKP